MNTDDIPGESTKHSIWQSLLLHLVPGVLIFIVYFVSASILINRLPSVALLAALSLGIALALIPFELGYLILQGWRKYRSLSLCGIVLYREPIRVWDYVLFVPLLLIWAVFCFAFISPPIEAYLQQTVFAWWPNWLIPSAIDTSTFSTNPTLGLIALASLSFQAIIGPIVEELYFRGYLLPRLSHLKTWAPLINTVLFSLYHFFTPWQNPARILALLPAVYLVQRKRNIYLGIVFHVVLNLMGQGIIAVLSR
ncbi:MAG TPA: CPBP family intramembrane metalloprotease [Chloroflexi bacterium]|nr:CPBP family intramembrane metalloprotease [Chloroflexota bacterium]